MIAQTQTEWAPDEPTVIQHFGLRLQNLEKEIFTSGKSCLKLE